MAVVIEILTQIIIVPKTLMGTSHREFIEQWKNLEDICLHSMSDNIMVAIPSAAFTYWKVIRETEISAVASSLKRPRIKVMDFQGTGIRLIL